MRELAKVVEVVKEISFSVLGRCSSWKRPGAAARRVGTKPDGSPLYRASMFTQSSHRKEADRQRQAFKQHMDGVIHEGPVEVSLTYYFKPPKSPKWRREMAERGDLVLYNLSDSDNLAKLTLDCLQGIFFVDDRQVFRLTTEKRYGKIEKLEVKMTLLRERQSLKDELDEFENISTTRQGALAPWD